MPRATTPTRRQENWDEVKKFLKQEWPGLTEVDLEEIDGEYDRLIHKIKEIYRGPDEITQEASIKGKIKKWVDTISTNH